MTEAAQQVIRDLEAANHKIHAFGRRFWVIPAPSKELEARVRAHAREIWQATLLRTGRVQ